MVHNAIKTSLSQNGHASMCQTHLSEPSQGDLLVVRFLENWRSQETQSEPHSFKKLE